MTTNLSTWAQSHGALYDASAAQASDETAFRTAFDTVFSPNVQIITNHEPMTRDELLDMVRSRNVSAIGTTIEWKDVMEIPKADSDPHEAGIVTGIFVVTRSLRFRIRVGPAQTRMAIVFSAKIEADSSVKEGDPRRIVHLLQTVVDQPVLIDLHGGAAVTAA